jgi:hypothetical protein
MSYAAPFELLTDAAGSATFGWADQGVYYARFSRALSARVGEAFAGHLRQAVQDAQRGPIKYFGDAQALETYDLLARSAFVRVVNEHRRKFEQLTLLPWAGGEISGSFLSALGDAVYIAKDSIDFESRLLACAPRARAKLAGKADARHRSRWPLRR